MLAAAGALALSGCGGHGGTGSTAASPTTTTVPRHGGVGHAAPDLEALLPDEVDGLKLRKGSTTGAVVFGGNAFGGAMTRFLGAHGKGPGDLRFANAQTAPNGPELELGVFQVRGLSGSVLRRAIVSSSRPNAPGLTATDGSLAGRAVTKVVYPGGAILYLYPSGDRVFYVGTQDEALAARIVKTFP